MLVLPVMSSTEHQNLKNAGLKATLPRMKILELLERSDARHVTAEDLYRKLFNDGEEIGLATVYRVLTQFESAGLVIRHRFAGNTAVYELDRGNHHDHMVCIRCGRIVEFMDETIEQRQQKVAGQEGFALVDHKLTMYVDCRREKCKYLKAGG